MSTAARFEEFARTERTRTPLYAAMAEAAARSSAACRLLEVAPEDEQRRAVLLFAAIHDRLLAEPGLPYARWFPTVSGGPADPEAAAAGLDSFCREHLDALATVIRTRRTQTNEIGRAGALAAACGAAGGGATGLVEVGASAGLLLAWPRFRLEMGDEFIWGDRDAPVSIRVALRGNGHLPANVAAPASVLGLDLSPVELQDDRQARWLLACVWADDLVRFARLRSAMELVRADPPPVLRGDAVDGLHRTVGAVAADQPLIVWNSWALSYVSPARRRAFTIRLGELAARRPLVWVSAESPAETPELPRPDAPLHRAGATDVVATTWHAGTPRARRLGEMHPHGHWLDWYAEPVT